MRTPEWWGADAGAVLPSVLAPLAWGWGLAARVRRAAVRPWRAGVPVLCVGNLVAGGAGKTPLALDLGARLAGQGVAVRFLTRGHGGGEVGPLRVDAERHGALQVGDEALLLARSAPTWVARDRRAGARAAVADGADVIVMDDGFQNPALVKDLSLIAIDGGYGFGNGRLIPAGPLREDIAGGLARATAVVLIGADEAGVGERLAKLSPLPVLRARLRPGPEARELAGRAVVAFAGIGRPAKFFATLRDIGCRVVANHAFADHHPYRAADLDRLEDEARAADAKLVTTAKDAQRLPAAAKGTVRVLTITLEWEEETALDPILEPVLPR